jgi:hypothetical protein
MVFMSSVDPVVDPLSQFVQSLEQVPDPRSSRGQSYFFSTILGVVFLGLLDLSKKGNATDRRSLGLARLYLASWGDRKLSAFDEGLRV